MVVVANRPKIGKRRDSATGVEPCIGCEVSLTYTTDGMRRIHRFGRGHRGHRQRLGGTDRLILSLPAACRFDYFGDNPEQCGNRHDDEKRGAGNMAETNSPPQMEIKQITVETTIAANGDREMMFTVAAGVTTRANISNVPTAGTAMVITPAIMAIETNVHEIHRHAFCLRHLFIKRAEQQRSIDNGQNGQQQHVENRKSDDLPVRDRQDGAERIDCICCEAELDKRAKNRPMPVANANTVPVAISRCDLCPVHRSPMLRRERTRRDRH